MKSTLSFSFSFSSSSVFPLLLGGVLLGGVVAACTPEQNETIDEYGSCAQSGTTLTYDNFGKGFLEGNCQRCHGQPEDQRNGAPPDATFATHEEVVRWKDRIFARACVTLGRSAAEPGPRAPGRLGLQGRRW